MNSIGWCYNYDNRGGDSMRSDISIIKNVKSWLEENDRTQGWLASEMGVAASLISQIFNGERRLQPKHIVKFTEITGKSVVELTGTEEKDNQFVYNLRGKLSNEAGERAFRQLKLDAEHFIQLLMD